MVSGIAGGSGGASIIRVLAAVDGFLIGGDF